MFSIFDLTDSSCYAGFSNKHEDNLMLTDRKTFFATIRASTFGGKLKASQVTGIEALLDAFLKKFPKKPDTRWLAYMLATVFHETGGLMQPVRETFAKNDAEARLKLHKRAYVKADPCTGHSYYGRGLVQITWKSNYEMAGKKLKLDLVGDPDLTLRPDVAVKITVEGMVDGWFTGKPLSKYFNESKTDPTNARRVINGLDRASDIAVYYHSFYDALVKGGMARFPG